MILVEPFAALETSLAYNALDVINLERLMVEAYNRKIGETPFALVNELTLPEVPSDLLYEPDKDTYERMRRKIQGRGQLT